MLAPLLLPVHTLSFLSVTVISLLSTRLFVFQVLDVGPGVCSYRWQVTLGQLVGVGPGVTTARPGEALVPFPGGRVGLVPVAFRDAPGSDNAEGEQECVNVGGCQFLCIAGGLALVLDETTIRGAAADPACSCPALSGQLADGAPTLVAPPWRFSLDRPTGLLRYQFAGETPCVGLLNVSGGTFLGAPAPPQLALGGSADPSLTNASSSVIPPGDIAPFSVGAAEAAATVTSAAVGAAVGAVVAGAVAGAVGGAVAGSAAGAAAPPSGATVMIQQTQFLGLAARVGGPGAQPDSSRAFSSGLSWSNFHVISFWPKSNSTVTDSSARRAVQGGGGDDGADNSLVAALEDEGVDGCQAARESERELLATVATCAVVMVAVYFFRIFINLLIWALLRRKARKNGDEMPEYEASIPFLAWEVQVYLVMFQGLAESSGEVSPAYSCSHVLPDSVHSIQCCHSACAGAGPGPADSV